MGKILLLDYLKLTFGCCFGPKSMITLHGNSVTFCKDLSYNAENKQKKEVSDESKAVLISELNGLKILNWDNHYMNPVLDGDEWDLEMVFNDGKKKSITGFNSYPGSGEWVEKSPEFKKLLNALNNLIDAPGWFH
jgi:hypothetical protein